MKRLPAVLAVLMLLSISALPAGAQGRIAWRGWNEGLKEARKSGKPVLVDVYTDWCGWCKRMDRDVYARADVREYLASRFVSVKLNAEAPDAAQYENRAYTSTTLAERFRVTGYPTTVFLKPDGAHLINVPGYVPADRFLLVLRYIGDGHMEKGVAWETYLERSAAKP
jgi:thioredoxin-related protein